MVCSFFERVILFLSLDVVGVFCVREKAVNYFKCQHIFTPKCKTSLWQCPLNCHQTFIQQSTVFDNVGWCWIHIGQGLIYSVGCHLRGACQPGSQCKQLTAHVIRVKSLTSQKDPHYVYPSFCSIKQLRILLLPPGWDASTLLGYPQQFFVGIQFFTTWAHNFWDWINVIFEFLLSDGLGKVR